MKRDEIRNGMSVLVLLRTKEEIHWLQTDPVVIWWEEYVTAQVISMARKRNHNILVRFKEKLPEIYYNCSKNVIDRNSGYHEYFVSIEDVFTLDKLKQLRKREELRVDDKWVRL